MNLDRRVNGILAVARSMGDEDLHPAVDSEPDVFEYSINRWNAVHVDLSDAMSDDEIITVSHEIKSDRSQNTDNSTDLQKSIYYGKQESKEASISNESLHSYVGSYASQSLKSQPSTHSLPQHRTSNSNSSPYSSASLSQSSSPSLSLSPAINSTQASLKQIVLPNPVFPLSHIPVSLAHILDEWLKDPVPYKTVHHEQQTDETKPTILLKTFIAAQTSQQRKAMSLLTQTKWTPRICMQLKPSLPANALHLQTSASIASGDNNNAMYSSSNAEISTSTVSESTTIVCSGWKREDIALVLGCDGLFDVVDNQLLAELVCPWMEEDNEDILSDPVFTAPDSDSEEEETTCEGNVDKCNSSSRKEQSQMEQRNQKSYSCKCHRLTKGKLAELSALRLRSCADALDSLDNISIIVVML